jgi:hypothetical protein
MLCNDLATVRQLIAAGADMAVTNSDGNNCLHIAAFNSCLPVVVDEVLNCTTFEVMAVNNAGETPAQIAHARGFTELAALFDDDVQLVLEDLEEQQQAGCAAAE